MFMYFLHIYSFQYILPYKITCQHLNIWNRITGGQFEGAHHGCTNPIAYRICKFATSQARWSYHSTSQPAYESLSASWYILPAD